MSDNVRVIIGALGALASKDVLTKLLGPTADYVGIGTRNLVQRGVENFNRILAAMYEKIKKDIDDEGEVNVRVLKSVWDDGRFVDDAIATEYFAGILASARTEDGRDDSGLLYSELLSAMSSGELRLHFILYSLVAAGPHPKDLTATDFWNGLRIAVNARELLREMSLETADGPATLLMSLRALIQHNLARSEFSVDLNGVKEANGIKLVDDTVIVLPNPFGASLFLRALGLKGIHPEVIGSMDVQYGLSEAVKTTIEPPTQFKCYRRPPPDPVSALMEGIEDRFSDFESAIDEVKDELEKKADARVEND
jgi:hypothetical protein